jgi:hypothetical protein
MSELDPRLRSALTIVVMCALLFGGGAWAWKVLTKPLPEPPKADTSLCDEVTLKPGERVTPDLVTVSVFNSGTRAGLAQRTLGLFTDQGFGAGKMGNAKDAGVKKAEIWTDDPTDPAVQLVASRLPGVEINEGPALGPGVVVLVGDKFGGLTEGKPGIAVSSDASICVPRETAAPEAP